MVDLVDYYDGLMISFQNEGPLKVELVSSGVSSWLPLAALVISLLSVALTLWFRYSDRLILKVAMGTSMFVGRPGEDRVTVTVTNASRNSSTQVSNIVLEFNSLSGPKTFVNVKPWPYDTALPIVLGPGESATASYSKKELGLELGSSAETLAATWIRGRAACGHKTFFGKKERNSPAYIRAYAIEQL